MELDVSFDGKTKCTPVYIMMTAQEQQLLLKGVCSQLGIVTYHPEVKRSPMLAEDQLDKHFTKNAPVPLVCARLLQSVKLPPPTKVRLHK